MNAEESLKEYYQFRIECLEDKLEKTNLLLKGYKLVNKELNKRLKNDRKSKNNTR